MGADDVRDLVKLTLIEINNYFKLNKEDLEISKARAFEYIRSWIKQLFSKDTKTLDTVLVNPQSTGYFYMMGYSSLLYEQHKLPHYDSVPLIMVLGMYKANSPDGHNLLYWVGLNFHWIHVRYRAVILKKLIQYDPQSFFQERRIDGMSYHKMKAILGADLLKRCSYAIRKYRYDRLRAMAKGQKVFRVKNSDIVKVLAFNPIVPVGIDRKQVPWAIRKAMANHPITP